MRVAHGADHGCLDMKTLLAMRPAQAGQILIDFGNTVYDPGDDHPDSEVPLARTVAAGKVDRAALIHEQYSARRGVERDNLNVLCLGARTTGVSIAWQCVVGFLGARFGGAGRYRRRLAKVAQLDEYFAPTGN